jgi:hypothetical protein
MLISIIEKRNPVPFPTFEGERIYMREFTKAAGLPADLSRWQPTVDAMLLGVETDGPIYLMVDQSCVLAGQPQRRPGVHVDNNWIAGHWDNGGWGKGCHGNGGHGHRRMEVSQGLVLATDTLGGRAFAGNAIGTCRDGGDCSHLKLDALDHLLLEPGFAWAMDAQQTLHESIPVPQDCKRTLVRLNISGWCPTA